MKKNTLISNKQWNVFAVISALLLTTLYSCTKLSPTEGLSKSSASNATDTGYIITPFGKMSKANVHLVENGYQVKMANGHAFKIHSSSKEVVEDWGELHPQIINNSTQTPNINPTESGWLTWAQWFTFNNTTLPINQFTTNWTAPYFVPSSSDNEVIFIFNGLVNSDFILQPVLQWGNNGAFGGSYWCISNWFAGPKGSNVGAYTSPVTVANGTQLEGELVYTGQESDGSYNYTSSFAGYSNSMNITQGETYSNNVSGGGTYTIPSVAEPFEAVATLEADGVNSAADFPQQWGIAMQNMSLSVGNPGAISYVTNADWSPQTGTSAEGYTVTMGENTQLLNNNTSEVQANLFFSSTPLNPIMYADYSYGGTSGYGKSASSQVGTGAPSSWSETGVIAATPGYTVTVTIEGDIAKGGSNGTQTFSINTSGVTLSTGSSSMTVTQGTKKATFVMPATGYVTWSGSFSWTSSGAEHIGGGTVSIE